MEQLPKPELIKFSGIISHDNAERLKTISVLNGKSVPENVRISVGIYEEINNVLTNGLSMKVKIDDELYDLEPYQHAETSDKSVRLLVNVTIPTHKALFSHQEDQQASPDLVLNTAIGQYTQLFEHNFRGEPVYVYYPETDTYTEFILLNTA